MFCTNCGKEILENTNVCTNCGAQTHLFCQKENSISKSKDDYFFKQNNLSTIKFFFIQILFLIPVLNIFFIIYWSLKKDINPTLKAYSRSMLIWVTIFFILFIFFSLTMIFVKFPLLSNFKF